MFYLNTQKAFSVVILLFVVGNYKSNQFFPHIEYFPLGTHRTSSLHIKHQSFSILHLKTDHPGQFHHVNWAPSENTDLGLMGVWEVLSCDNVYQWLSLLLQKLQQKTWSFFFDNLLCPEPYC